MANYTACIPTAAHRSRRTASNNIAFSHTNYSSTIKRTFNSSPKDTPYNIAIIITNNSTNRCGRKSFYCSKITTSNNITITVIDNTTYIN